MLSWEVLAMQVKPVSLLQAETRTHIMHRHVPVPLRAKDKGCPALVPLPVQLLRTATCLQ